MPDPDMGTHAEDFLKNAEHSILEDVGNSLPVKDKLSVCLELAEKYGFEKVAIHLEGIVKERKVSSWRNKLNKLRLRELDGKLELLTKVSGDVLYHHRVRKITELKKYTNEFEELSYFSLTFGDGYHCVRCRDEGLEIAADKKEFTVLYKSLKCNRMANEILNYLKSL